MQPLCSATRKGTRTPPQVMCTWGYMLPPTCFFAAIRGAGGIQQPHTCSTSCDDKAASTYLLTRGSSHCTKLDSTRPLRGPQIRPLNHRQAGFQATRSSRLISCWWCVITSLLAAKTLSVGLPKVRLMVAGVGRGNHQVRGSSL